MKNILLSLLLCPLLSIAQKIVPRFEYDTLYTTSGYKIYKGVTLHFAKGTAKNGNFRFVKVKNTNGSHSLTNNSMLVKNVDGFKISGLGNGYIRIQGTIFYKDGTKGLMDINMTFDRAIESFPGLPSELIVPDEFKNKQKLSVADEIGRLYKLYQDSILTKEEYEAQKKKLLDQ
jgi:hypothetical protein